MTGTTQIGWLYWFLLLRVWFGMRFARGAVGGWISATLWVMAMDRIL